MDLWKENSDPFVQAVCLFFFVGNILCVQVSKQFLADRVPPTSRDSLFETNHTNVSAFESPDTTNTTDTAPGLSSSFESDIEKAYFIFGASCIVGTVIQILSWCHSGCKLSQVLQVTEGEAQSPSAHNSNFHGHSKMFVFGLSFLLCLVSFLGFANGEMFGAFGITFTVNCLDWSPSDASNLITLYLISTLVCICVSILLSKFVQVNILMIVGILIGFSATILMTSLVTVTKFSLWIGACLLGLGLGNILPNTLNAGKRLTDQSSIISSVIFAGAYTGRIVAPQVIGYLLDHEDPMWFLYLGVVYSGGMLVLSVVFQIVLRCNRNFENMGQQECDVPLETLETPKWGGATPLHITNESLLSMAFPLATCLCSVVTEEFEGFLLRRFEDIAVDLWDVLNESELRGETKRFVLLICYASNRKTYSSANNGHTTKLNKTPGFLHTNPI